VRKHRGKLIVLAVFVAALWLAGWVFWTRPVGPGQRINPHTVLRVRPGMTQEQIEAIFGAPPGDYSSEMRGHQAKGLPQRPPELRREDWTADEGGAVVYFGADGRVKDAVLWTEPNYKTNDGPVRFRLRKWCYELGIW
jgi:hypothetical protein